MCVEGRENWERGGWKGEKTRADERRLIIKKCVLLLREVQKHEDKVFTGATTECSSSSNGGESGERQMRLSGDVVLQRAGARVQF